jgi:hypothetical protein
MIRPGFITAIQLYTVKIGWRFSCPQPRVWLLTSGLGTEKTVNFFLQCIGLNIKKNISHINCRSFDTIVPVRFETILEENAFILTKERSGRNVW